MTGRRGTNSLRRESRWSKVAVYGVLMMEVGSRTWRTEAGSGSSRQAGEELGRDGGSEKDRTSLVEIYVVVVVLLVRIGSLMFDRLFVVVVVGR